MSPDILNALIGGVIIGIAVSLMLLLNGRVVGISGIINATLTPQKGDFGWRIFFLSGLILGGLTLKVFNPAVFNGALDTETWTVVVAGLMVGFGTIMGSGCTSGHGVCGMSRLSMRSIVATLTFILSGVLSVFLLKKLGVLP
jgi:uncharacterized membrane protein YedE/YeeE